MKNVNAPEEEIDFIMLWVDGSDPEWLKDKRKYSFEAEDDDRPQRYRDFGLLKYWFRGVEEFAPWVRRIHFVTWGHLPKWLDTSHPKLNIVNHRDYMDEAYLPTYSSHGLELNMFRIKGLSDKFVYFNDDIVLINHISPRDFFRDGKPVDMLALQPVVSNPANPVMTHVLQNDSLLICKYFDKHTQMRRHKGKFFNPRYPLMYLGYNILELVFPLYTGFYTVHCPSPFLKSTFETLWEKEGDLLDEVSRRKFRSPNDVNQYIFREWQKQTGEFVPSNLHRVFSYIDVAKDYEKAVGIIRKQKRKMICLNDSDRDFDFEAVRDGLLSALEAILPNPSAFEIKERTE